MSRAYNVKDLLSKKFDIMRFTGSWEESFGRPCKQFSMMIYGDSGSGKTELAIQLSRYLTNFGLVHYNSIEQGISHTLQMAMKRNNMEQVADKFKILDKEQLPEITKRLRKQRSPDFLIIDSIQYLKMTKDEYFKFKSEFYPKKGIIFICQLEKGNIKGALARDIWYDVDIQVPVEGFRGIPQKRMNGGGKPYIVNAERAAIYHGELK
ncbi:ATP-binding protein [Polaribacter undariae]|uniref:ATP-binding protein n=1 Tax=Polaribacter sejongensis TaxID=985043 RepID=A0AAJ1R077_9FLAO|nr:ATP-binding protein [Polaribacter undariae]MDN3621310.1 ATP-binding protein [Polaribacter undariae]UWD31852.1 ATP-binding protein [Polaribacter undariae]